MNVLLKKKTQRGFFTPNPRCFVAENDGAHNASLNDKNTI
jgi:hypothetical protein